MQADEVVATIETDKVNVEIRSPHSGVIQKYYANAGDTVQVDANFFDIDTEAKGPAATQAAAPAKEAPAAAPKKVTTNILLLINKSGRG